MRKMVRSAYAAEASSELAETLEDWVAEADAETELDVPDAPHPAKRLRLMAAARNAEIHFFMILNSSFLQFAVPL